MRESSAPFVPDFGRPGFPVVTLPIAGDAHSPVAPKWPQDKKGVSQKRLTPCNYWSRGPDLLPRAEGVKELAGPKGRETDDLRVMSALHYPHLLTYTCIHHTSILVNLAQLDHFDASLGPVGDQEYDPCLPRRTCRRYAEYSGGAAG